MDQIKKNTVKAVNQLAENDIIHFYGEGKGKKLMFVGNSITLHAPKAEIGWNHNWGMAASDISRDYVHLCMDKVKDEYDTFCVCSAYEWEYNYKHGSELLYKYEQARNFGADVIVMRIVENCPGSDFEPDVFEAQYNALLDYLNPEGKSRFVFTTSFWKRIGDDSISKIAKSRNSDCIYLGDLGEDESMKAIGLFEHSGVANHPGDKGMKYIADRICMKILPN